MKFMAQNLAPISPPARKRDGPTPNALPEALIQRFADDVARLTEGGTADRFGIAVSGGSDSLAMLLLASAAFPGRVEAATVDHRLRPASTGEAQFVAGLCAKIAVPHAILTIGPLQDGNISNEARKARYAALADWADAAKIDWTLTAHHADDQLETMLMRLNRGAGVAGLSGVRARQGQVIRPLLHWRRDTLAALVADMGITAVDDPTNRDDRYDRARLRKSLADVDWINPLSVAISADALGDADAALTWAVDKLAGALIRAENDALMFDRRGTNAPDEIIRRLVLRCLRLVEPDADPRGQALSRFIDTLDQGGSATLGDVHGRGGKIWRFLPAPPRRNTAL
jgi:tRNA(Ile)-lysidine synthase